MFDMHSFVYGVGAVIVDQALNWDAVKSDGHGFAVNGKFEGSVIGEWTGSFHHPLELEQLLRPLSAHVLTGACDNLLKVRHVGFAMQALGY